MLRWLADDLNEMSFERGGVSKRMAREAEENYRPGDPTGARYGIGPAAAHVAGTPTLEMFHALGIKGSRPAIAAKLNKALAGEKVPAKFEALADAMREAFDGQRFDFQLVSDETLAKLGARRRDLRSPITTPNPDDMPDVIRRLFASEP